MTQANMHTMHMRTYQDWHCVALLLECCVGHVQLDNKSNESEHETTAKKRLTMDPEMPGSKLALKLGN